MKFSICVPNYNYEKFVGATVHSALAQTYGDLEVLFSDNVSTDRSVDVVRAIDDPRLSIKSNRCNVGFAANLDKAAARATGDFLVMLSSDDLMRPTALETYEKIVSALPSERNSLILSASCDVIDPQDKVISQWRIPEGNVWRPEDRDERLSTLVGASVYRVAGPELMRRALPLMQNPFFFLATCYSRCLYEQVEGYGNSRGFSPDKWFYWRTLPLTKSAIFVETPLFAYRWHGLNQASLQSATGALREYVDEYLNTIELDGQRLKELGLSREDVYAAYIEHTIARKGLSTLGQGNRLRAKRIYLLGKSNYPSVLRSNKKAWVLRALLALGPIGTLLGKALYSRHRQQKGRGLPV